MVIIAHPECAATSVDSDKYRPTASVAHIGIIIGGIYSITQHGPAKYSHRAGPRIVVQT